MDFAVRGTDISRVRSRIAVSHPNWQSRSCTKYLFHVKYSRALLLASQERNEMTGIEQFRYDGKRALVVGGATGMGAAAAKIVGDLGAEVINLDYAPVEAGLGRGIQVDLRDPASIDRALEEVGGPVDALFSAAGIADGPDLMKINFIGHRHVIDKLISNGQLGRGGAICFISSVAGIGWETDLPRLQEFLATPDFESADAWSQSPRGGQLRPLRHQQAGDQRLCRDACIPVPGQGHPDQRDLPGSDRHSPRPGQCRPVAVVRAGLPRGHRHRDAHARADGQRDGVPQQRRRRRCQRRDPARRLRTRQLVEYRDVRSGQADHRLAHGPHLAGLTRRARLLPRTHAG